MTYASTPPPPPPPNAEKMKYAKEQLSNLCLIVSRHGFGTRALLLEV